MRGDERRADAVMTSVARVRYGECSRHTFHATKASARRAMREHVRRHAAGILRCRKCQDGRSPGVFACFGWVEHYHWGHGE